jgi:hypothetical protein
MSLAWDEVGEAARVELESTIAARFERATFWAYADAQGFDRSRFPCKRDTCAVAVSSFGIHDQVMTRWAEALAS